MLTRHNSMGSHNLSESACEKDIGIYIDPHLHFETHIINKAKWILAIACKTLDCMDRVCFNHIITRVAPWGPDRRK